MSETLEIPLKDLGKWLEQETAFIVEPLKTEVEGLLENVRSKLDDVLETSDKLLEDAEKGMNKGGSKTYRRSKVAYKFAKNISELIDKVTFPDQISHESIDVICEDLGRTIATIGRERWKWFPVISPYFIIDRRRFDIALKRAGDSLQQLRSFSTDKYEKAKTVENSFSMIDKLLQLSGELDEVEGSRKKTELRRRALEKKILEEQQEIASIQGKSEVVELVSLNKKIEELRRVAKHSLRHLRKPFVKLQSLARGPGFPLPPDELKKLSEYLNNPFEALATEHEGYPTLKSILRKMEGAIAQGKLKLKTSRLRKAEELMSNSLKDSLTPLQRSCKEAFSQRQQLSRSGVIANSKSELAQLQKTLEDLQKRKELVDSREAVLDKKNRKTLEKIEEQKKELEKLILELTKRNVQVTL